MIAKTDKEKRKGKYIFDFKFRRKKGVEENRVFRKGEKRKGEFIG